MSDEPFDSATLRVVLRANELFIDQGYARVTMTALADACRLTRRGLYHHFRSKEDIFRATLRLTNARHLQAADKAARAEMITGSGALDVLTEWFDVRFGEVRRLIKRLPHGDELNAVAFRIGHDIMIEVSRDTNAHLAALIGELCVSGKMQLREGVTGDEAATLLSDGARGVNQDRPNAPTNQIRKRYRGITAAILYGCCASPPDD